MTKIAKFTISLCAILAFIWISSSLLIFHGPYPMLRSYIIDSLVSTNHFRNAVRPLSLFTVSQEEVSQRINAMHDPNVGAALNSFQDEQANLKNKSFKSLADGQIAIEQFSAKTFSAKIMLIRDPKRMKVAVTKYLGKAGQSVSDMASDNGAVAGINGGLFDDPAWRGTGGIPYGNTVVDGKAVTATNDKKTTTIGVTSDGVLIVGNYSAEQLKQLGVKQSVSFGPVLVQNGEGRVVGNGNWGNAPRSAIGQKEDGTIILIVTDGRMVHGPSNLGATIKDMQDLMLSYGAVTAANLDGGSSTTLCYNGQLVNDPTNILGERKVATAILVMPEVSK